MSDRLSRIAESTLASVLGGCVLMVVCAVFGALLKIIKNGVSINMHGVALWCMSGSIIGLVVWLVKEKLFLRKVYISLFEIRENNRKIMELIDSIEDSREVKKEKQE